MLLCYESYFVFIIIILIIISIIVWIYLLNSIISIIAIIIITVQLTRPKFSSPAGLAGDSDWLFNVWSFEFSSVCDISEEWYAIINCWMVCSYDNNVSMNIIWLNLFDQTRMYQTLAPLIKSRHALLLTVPFQTTYSFLFHWMKIKSGHFLMVCLNDASVTLVLALKNISKLVRWLIDCSWKILNMYNFCLDWDIYRYSVVVFCNSSLGRLPCGLYRMTPRDVITPEEASWQPQQSQSRLLNLICSLIEIIAICDKQVWRAEEMWRRDNSVELTCQFSEVFIRAVSTTFVIS